jgi:uncharacterized protein (UPF0333 family)
MLILVVRTKRGQAAIEYLIIFALAVIIAIIVIGASGGFPGLAGGVTEKDSASYWSGADIGITRYYISQTSGNSQIVIRNNLQSHVNVTNITFNGGSGLMSAEVPLAPGSSASLNLTGTQCATAGQSYSNTVVITYVDAVYGTTGTFTGEKSLVGICQN